MSVIIDIERNGDTQMNSIRNFRRLLSILMLYAANIIVPDVRTVTDERTGSGSAKRITGRTLLRLTANK